MILNVNQSKVNASVIQQTKDMKQEEIPKKEEKAQLKEHCSSKTAKALRGMVIGLALAAGVSAGSKGMVVQAGGNNTPIQENNTAVSQEVEENMQKSEVEMMADKLLDESEGTTTTLHVGDKNNCWGKMTLSAGILGGRNYDIAKITEGGCLVFYQEVQHEDSDGYTHTNYIPENSFDLGTEAEGKSIQLKTGSRFEESSKMHGDYIELAKDGRTFVVYNKDGKKIGKVKVDTPETHRNKVIACVAGGVTAFGVACVLKKEMNEDD